MNGYILHEGPSQLDGSPIAVIATGLAGRSRNRKTGPMIQVWVLRSDVDPVSAVREGADESICGDCPFRGSAGRGRACYVNVGQAPLAVWRPYLAGRYGRDWPDSWPRPVRIGAYGDPAAAPVRVWDRIAAAGGRMIGYTHQWRICDPALRRYCMASVETAAAAAKAQAAGWRTFRVSLDGQPAVGEFICPATTMACDGALRSTRIPSVVIRVHGSLPAVHSYRRFVNGFQD